MAVSESKVLVIYTGGTIGMLSLAGKGNTITQGGGGGLAPEPFFLTETLRSQSRFHDPFEDSLFSHSSSVEGFRKWNVSQSQSVNVSGTSGRTSPFNPTFGQQQQLIHRSIVRSSSPIIHPLYPASVPITTSLLNENVDRVYYETQLPTLVTPRTHSPAGFLKRIRYAIMEVRF
jgi:60kDa lysophospholipase